MVVPVGKVRLIVTASDVIHSWAVPAFGKKIDAVPGRLNELWFQARDPGIYYGQCSELCGANHAFMPIGVMVVTRKNTPPGSRRRSGSGKADQAPRFARQPPPARPSAGVLSIRVRSRPPPQKPSISTPNTITGITTSSGPRRWLFSTNHKDIGTMYLIFAIIAGIVGGAMSVAMRMELAEPGLQWFGDAPPLQRLRHRPWRIMVFFMVMPAMIGGFGNWFVPLHDRGATTWRSRA